MYCLYDSSIKTVLLQLMFFFKLYFLSEGMKKIYKNLMESFVETNVQDYKQKLERQNIQMNFFNLKFKLTSLRKLNISP